MGGSDRDLADGGRSDGQRAGRSRRGSDPAAGTGAGTAAGSGQCPPVPDDREGRDRPLSDRSPESTEIEIDDPEQNLERYETRDQAVIDRYEGLLAERQRRQRAVDAHREDEYRQRLRRVKNRLLRTFGLR